MPTIRSLKRWLNLARRGGEGQFVVRLGMAASLALHFIATGKSFAECAWLFKPGKLNLTIRALRAQGMRAENLSSLIHRQSPRVEQSILELVINAIENLTQKKIIGRFGGGRLQCLRQVVNSGEARVEVTTKAAHDLVRFLELTSLPEYRNDVAVSLREANPDDFSHGTRIKLCKRLTVEEQKNISQYLAAKLKYVRGVAVLVNGEQINKHEDGGNLYVENVQPAAGSVRITLNDHGFMVQDDGQGMDAEAVVKRYLAIGNSEGEHQRNYDDAIQPANIYYDQKGESAKRGKVSFLMCGVEIEGVEIGGLNLAEELGVEMGTGLDLEIAKDKVSFGGRECQRLHQLVVAVLQMPGERKWSIVNSLMKAIDQIEFKNGEKEKFINGLAREVRSIVANTEQIVFIPNRTDFAVLNIRSSKQRVCLDERLFDFDPPTAGLREHGCYESQRGYRLFEADFTDDQRVYIETGKTIIINSQYLNNPLLINLLFNFWVGYGPQVNGKVRIKLPWEIKSEGGRAAAEQLADGTSSAEERFLAELMEQGRGREEAGRILTRIAARVEAVKANWSKMISLPWAVEDSIFIGQGEILRPVGGRLYFLFEQDDGGWGLREFGVENKLTRVVSRDWQAKPKVFSFNNRSFVCGKKAGEWQVVELIPEGEFRIAGGYDVWPTMYETNGRKFICGEIEGRGRAEMLTGGGAAVISDGYNYRPLISGGNGRIFIGGMRGSQGVLEELVEEQEVILISDKYKLPPVAFTEAGQMLICGKYDEGRCGLESLGGGRTLTVCRDDFLNLPVIYKTSDSTFVIGKCNSEGSEWWGAFVLGSGSTIGFLSLRGELAFPPAVHEAGGRKFFVFLSKGWHVVGLAREGKEVPDFIYDTGSRPVVAEVQKRSLIFAKRNGVRVVDEIVEGADGSLRLLPFLAEHLGGELMLSARAAEIGSQFDRPLPESLPAQQNWFKDRDEQILYQAGRSTMLARIIRGDYIEGTPLELSAFLGEKALTCLGTELIRLLANRISAKNFMYQYYYLGFIAEVWLKSKETIEPDLFKRIAQRWDQLFDIFSENIEEIKRLRDLLLKTGVLAVLSGERVKLTNEEAAGWLRYFEQEGLAGVVKIEPAQTRISGEAVLAEVGRHDLAFYTWAARMRSGWQNSGVREHKKLLVEFAGLNLAPLRKRLLGVITGQHLAEMVYIRELARNSRQAGSNNFEVLTRVEERVGKLEHLAEYRDDGKGMTEAEVKTALLNIEGDGAKDGLGFKAVLKEANRVRVTTSTGNGEIIEVELVSVREAEKIMRVEVAVYRKYQGEMTGTIIQVVKELGERNSGLAVTKAILAELMFRQRLRRYAGLMRGMKIQHNGVEVREEIIFSESVTLPSRGEYSLLETDQGEERMTQDGFWISSQLNSYQEPLPKILRASVAGCVFDIDKTEQLVRGGAQPMDQAGLGKIFFVLAMRKAVVDHLLDERKILGLPADYLYGQDREFAGDLAGDLEGEIPAFIRVDAAQINAGNLSAVNFDRYREQEDELIKLLTLVKVKIGQRREISLQEIRDQVRDIALGRADLPQGGAPWRADFAAALMIKRQHVGQAERISKRKPVTELTDIQQKFLALVGDALSAMGAAELKTGLYTSTGESRLAVFHFGLDRGIFYRREAIDWADAARVLQKDGLRNKGKDYYRWFYDFLEDVIIHESVHARALDENWSHGADPRIDRSFAASMEETILDLIRTGYNPLR